MSMYIYVKSSGDVKSMVRAWKELSKRAVLISWSFQKDNDHYANMYYCLHNYEPLSEC